MLEQDQVLVKFVNKKQPSQVREVRLQNALIDFKQIKLLVKDHLKIVYEDIGSSLLKSKIWIKKKEQSDLVLISKINYSEKINTQDIEKIIYKFVFQEFINQSQKTQSQVKMLQSQVEQIYSQFLNLTFDSKLLQKKTDLVILFANPLVQLTPGHVQNIKETKGVDYISEIQAILSKLRKLNKQIKIEIEPLTIENFEKYLKTDLSILHLICHGVFVEGQYFLEFEKEDSSQLLIGQQYLAQINKSLRKNIKSKSLLFINACYSEQMSEFFKDFNFDSIITIQKEAKIKDVVSEEFSSIFYERLFSKNYIKESFDQTMAQVMINSQENPQKYHSCCCAHSHTKDCAMIQFMKDNNLVDFHEFHSPTQICLCPKKHQQIHLRNCKWKRLFLLQCSVQYEILEDQTVFVCCCQKGLQHTEQLKFKLEQFQNVQDVLSNNQQGQLQLNTQYIDLFISFGIESNYVGLNQKVYQIKKQLQQNLQSNIIFIQGKQGVGKTTLAIYLCLIQVAKKALKEFYNIDVSEIQDEVQEAIDLQIRQLDTNNQKYAFILDSFIINNVKQLQLIKKLSKTKNVIFLICLKEQEHLVELNELINQQISIELNYLTQTQAIQLFFNKQQFKEQLQSQYALINNKTFIEIFQNMELTP